MTSRPPPVLVLALRVLVYALTAAVFVWPLAHPRAAAAGAVAAALGVLLAARVSRSQLRSSVILALGLAAGLSFERLVAFLEGASGLARAFDPSGFLYFMDALRFGGAAGLCALTGSALALRHPWVSFLEVGAGGLVFSQLVADHRHGAINRPFEVADPIIATGGDPSVVFLTLGAFAGLLLALVLIWEKRVGRLFAHLFVLVALLGSAYLGADAMGALPVPEPSSNGLGLTGKPQKAEHKKNERGGGGRARDRSDNENLEFRDNQQNRDQQTPVAVVLLHDDYSPPTGVYYFRQGAFSQFNGRRLVGTTRDGLDRDVAEGFPVEKVTVQGAPEADYERALISSTVALMADHTRPFGLEAPVSFAPAQNPDAGRFRRVYEVHSAALTADFTSLLGRKSGSPGWSAEDRASYLAIPSDPRYRELAETITSKIPEALREDPMLLAWAIREWLAKEGTYSLRTKHSAAADPTGHFLFGDKTGYCVHFSHAATYLMRAVGVPARVATGYAVEESARQGGSAILISSGAAHAWPEIYLEGVGWVVVDVQPERTLDPPPEPADADLQRLLGQLARGMKPLAPDGQAPSFPLLAWLRDAALLAARSVAVGGLLLLILLYLAKLARALGPRFARGRDLPRLVYRAELDRLAELGVRRRPGESQEAFARRLADELPTWGRLTDVHLGARFGSTRALATPRPELLDLASAARAERARRFSFGRRLLGWLIPWSFLRSR